MFTLFGTDCIEFDALFDMGEELKVEVHCNLIKVARLLLAPGGTKGKLGQAEMSKVFRLYTPPSFV